MVSPFLADFHPEMVYSANLCVNLRDHLCDVAYHAAGTLIGKAMGSQGKTGFDILREETITTDILTDHTFARIVI